MNLMAIKQHKMLRDNECTVLSRILRETWVIHKEGHVRDSM
jgi:hypothetical protein